MDAIQKKVKHIIESESEFLYNFVTHMPDKQRNVGVLGLLPFLSVYVDGVAKWSIVALKKSNPLNKEEKQVYSAIRQGIKLFENDISTNISIIRNEMAIHEEAFLTEFFGDIICNEHIIGNTYLTGIYINITKLREIYKFDFDAKMLMYGNDTLNKLLKNTAVVGGKIIGLHAVRKNNLYFRKLEIEQNDMFIFDNSVYKIASYSDLCWLNLLCQINYVIYFLNMLTDNKDIFVFRCAYIVYYYALKIINSTDCEIFAENKWADASFRNALAHYGIKTALGENKLISGDAFAGLTNYFFDLSYDDLYENIVNELFSISSQLEEKYIAKPKA